MTNKEKLGFTNGYIVIFKGNTYPFKDWFKEQGARYNQFFGWYFASMPEKYPNELTPIKLPWETISYPDEDALKSTDEIKKVIDGIRFESSSSEFVGKIGNRINLEIFVDKVIPITGEFNKLLHLMHDNKNNEIIWFSSGKELAAGRVYNLKARVKEHRTYQNRKQTVINYCTIQGEEK